MITLTDEQNTCLKAIQDWLVSRSKPEFKMGGYAGTGKTTLVKSLMESLDSQHVVVAAFTGKACQVLRQKGIRAQTLHSLLYELEDTVKGKPVFALKIAIIPRPSLIIVDEASMLSTSLYGDLMSFNIPCLFIGDPGQLEPVGDNPNLMAQCDAVLKTIHRQAAENPILTLAHSVRMGSGIRYDGPADERLVFGNSLSVNTFAAQADQVICAMNKTRRNINDAFRKAHKRHALLEEGEKLLCLRNNRKLGAFNGMLFTVREIKEENRYSWDVVAIEGQETRALTIWKWPFLHPEEKHDYVPDDHIYCDYGYAITCHKSQGSEWDKVLVIDEWTPPRLWDRARWRYTAITRAAKQLFYVPA